MVVSFLAGMWETELRSIAGVMDTISYRVVSLSIIIL